MSLDQAIEMLVKAREKFGGDIQVLVPPNGYDYDNSNMLKGISELECEGMQLALSFNYESQKEWTPDYYPEFVKTS